MDRNVRDAVNVATRIAAGDDRTRYDGVAISLHWLTVFLVLANFALAETWAGFAKPTRHLMVATHMSFGILLAITVVARIVWRLMPGHQVSSANSGAVALASKAVHYLLYGLLALEAVLGFVLRWSGGEAMSFFGLAIPSPMATVSRATNHTIGDLHNWNGWAIIILAAGHAGAALYNHVVVKNDVLRRMLPQGARRSA
ncbi:MAG: cytochrome [Phenylobacterium sp.]|nr:cytochrome [Phenylobacterium sp.]